jgi:SPX domain protein involved in polyphosphate accumulation
MDKLEYDNGQFIETFKDEVEKVETFVVWKYGDLKSKMTRLQGQIRSMRRAKEDLEVLYE